MLDSGLYVVATPIGNLEDISYRAIRVLSGVSAIGAEDTRHTATLLRHYDIKTPVFSLHEHNEEQMVSGLVAKLQNGQALALVSDAGTPLISDPGFRLVREARQAGVPVYAVPGASAVTAALSVAGLPTDRFCFEGFLPARTIARKGRLDVLSTSPVTLVFYESSHRIKDCLQDMQSVFGPAREIAVCRELTKQFETVLLGPVAEVAAQVSADTNQRKGEFVVLVSAAPSNPEVDMQQAVSLAKALQEFLPLSQASRVAARIAGVSRRDLYARLDSDSGR